MASVTVNGRKVLRGSEAEPGSSKFLRKSGGKTVTLADGTKLNAFDSKNYGQGRSINQKTGEIINPTPEDIADWNSKYTTIYPNKKTPTVFTNTDIIEKKIPEMNSKVAGLPIYTPSNQQQDEQEDNVDDLLGLGGEKKDMWGKLRDRQKSRAEGALEAGAGDQEYADDYRMNLLNKMKETSDQGTRDQISLIENQAARLRAKQGAATAANVQGVRSMLFGAGGYRSGSGNASVLAAENAGIEKLADIDAQEREAVASARLAQQNGDYQLLGKQLDLIESIRSEKGVAAEEILETQRRSMRDGQIAELVGGGLTDPLKILQKLNAAGGDFTIDEIENVLGSITKSEDPADDILSVEESKKLGVPFGTTKREAFGIMAKTSGLEDLSPAQVTQMNTLADDYTTQSKEFFMVQNAYERVKAASKNPSAASDLALIFSFMKMLDPTSVVREQEFANAQNAAGVPERIRAQYNKIVSGERLTDVTRQDFVNQAKSQFDAQKGQQKQRNEVYGGRAEKFGIPRDFVVQPIDEIDSRTPDEQLQELYNESPENKEFIENILENEPDITSEDIVDLLSQGPISMQAERLADAIAFTESGNRQVAGASGEFGAFQFMPGTWAAISKEVSGKLLPQTPKNERTVAAKKIEKLLALGHTPEEVALIWNTSLGGTEEPRRIRGTNDKGVDYDSVAYAKKVLSNLKA